MANAWSKRMVMPALQVAGLSLLGLACDKEASQAAASAPAPQAVAPATGPAEAPSGAASPSEALRGELRIQGTWVTAGSEGNQAEVDAHPDAEYQWSIVGGAVTAGGDTPNATYSVDSAAKALHIFCKIKDRKGGEFTALNHQLVAPMPVIGSFAANPPAIGTGGNTKLTWQADGYKTLTMDPDAKDVAQWVGIPVQPKETTTYVLTATNAAGLSVKKEVVVKVVPPPSITRFAFKGVILVGQATTLTAEFANGKAEIWEGERLLASSDQSPLTIQVTPQNQSSYQLKVTNEAGASVTQTRVVQSAGY